MSSLPPSCRTPVVAPLPWASSATSSAPVTRLLYCNEFTTPEHLPPLRVSTPPRSLADNPILLEAELLVASSASPARDGPTAAGRQPPTAGRQPAAAGSRLAAAGTSLATASLSLAAARRSLVAAGCRSVAAGRCPAAAGRCLAVAGRSLATAIHCLAAARGSLASAGCGPTTPPCGLRTTTAALVPVVPRAASTRAGGELCRTSRGAGGGRLPQVALTPGGPPAGVACDPLARLFPCGRPASVPITLCLSDPCRVGSLYPSTLAGHASVSRGAGYPLLGSQVTLPSLCCA
jgi:hypothetical protein